jgi:hypothetical protein
MPLARVLADMPEHVITPEDLVEMAREASAPLDRSQTMGWADKQIRLAEAVRRAARRTRRLAECCVHLIRGNDHSRVKAGLDRLESAENVLRTAVKQGPLVSAWAHAQIDEVMSTSCSDEDNRKRAADGTQQEAALATAIENAARELKEELTRLGNRLARSAST